MMAEECSNHPDLESLLGFCTAEYRICPQPIAWHQFWLALWEAAKVPRDTGDAIAIELDEDSATYGLRSEPPAPNVLSSWVGTSDIQKMETVRRQLQWAADHDVLIVADKFLRGLKADDWHWRAQPTTGSAMEAMESKWRARAEEEREKQAENRARRLAAAQAHRDRKSVIDRNYEASLDKELVQAYRATAYTVFSDPEFALRIGEHSVALADFYERSDCNCAAYITAWNPLGAACAKDDNEAAQQRLIALVKELGLKYLKGEGRGEIGDWPPEESLFILGCTRSRAKAIGHRFKQNAVVWVGENGVPELVLLMPLVRKASESSNED